METNTKPNAVRNTRIFIRKIVETYRQNNGIGDRPLPYAHFAALLNQCVAHLNLHISHQSIKNWEDGIHRPDYFFTLQLANHAPEGSWQRAFAMDLLAVQWPMLYQPGSEIGEKYSKEILQNP